MTDKELRDKISDICVQHSLCSKEPSCPFFDPHSDGDKYVCSDTIKARIIYDSLFNNININESDINTIFSE